MASMKRRNMIVKATTLFLIFLNNCRDGDNIYVFITI